MASSAAPVTASYLALVKHLDQLNKVTQKKVTFQGVTFPHQMNDLIATWVDPANLTRTTRAAVTGIGKFLGGCFTSGPLKCFHACNHQILTKSASQKERIRKKA